MPDANTERAVNSHFERASAFWTDVYERRRREAEEGLASATWWAKSSTICTSVASTGAIRHGFGRAEALQIARPAVANPDAARAGRDPAATNVDGEGAADPASQRVAA